MLLRLEAEQARQFLVDGTKEVVRRKYEGLGARVEGRGTRDERVVDMIVSTPSLPTGTALSDCIMSSRSCFGGVDLGRDMASADMGRKRYLMDTPKNTISATTPWANLCG